MRKIIQKGFLTILSLFLIIGILSGCSSSKKYNGEDSSNKIEKSNKENDADSSATKDEGKDIEEEGQYTSLKDVSAYIYKYKKLPSNYIKKSDAKKLGFNINGKDLDQVAPGKSIGGDVFKNYEKKLPIKNGRVYYECDIDYKKGNRNAKRIIFSNDGLIYYTKDHYKTFLKIHGEE